MSECSFVNVWYLLDDIVSHSVLIYAHFFERLKCQSCYFSLFYCTITEDLGLIMDLGTCSVEY